MRILIIGREPSDFFNPICKELRRKKYEVDLLEYRAFNGLDNTYSKIYKNEYKLFNLNNYKKLDILFGFFSIYFIKCFLRSFSIKSSLRESLLFHRFFPIFDQYDIINFHAIEEKSILLSSFVPKKIKLVFSFWGSDLLVYKEGKAEKQKKALERASKITMQTPEMKAAYNHKFNSFNSNLIDYQLFGIESVFFDICKKLRSKNLSEIMIKERFKMPSEKIIITVSYCGKPVANQVPILKSINQLSSILKERIHLVIPLSYGSTLEYKNQIESCINKQEYTYTFIESYLEFDELILYKYASDIYVHANATDAFSRSMLENIYTENICLIGDWLPYSLLKKSGVNVVWFNNFESLTLKLDYVIKNIGQIRTEINNNPQIIEGAFSERATVKKWVEMFKGLE